MVAGVIVRYVGTQQAHVSEVGSGSSVEKSYGEGESSVGPKDVKSGLKYSERPFRRVLFKSSSGAGLRLVASTRCMGKSCLVAG